MLVPGQTVQVIQNGPNGQMIQLIPMAQPIATGSPAGQGQGMPITGPGQQQQSLIQPALQPLTMGQQPTMGQPLAMGQQPLAMGHQPLAVGQQVPSGHQIVYVAQAATPGQVTNPQQSTLPDHPPAYSKEPQPFSEQK